MKKEIELSLLPRVQMSSGRSMACRTTNCSSIYQHLSGVPWLLYALPYPPESGYGSVGPMVSLFVIMNELIIEVNKLSDNNCEALPIR